VKGLFSPAVKGLFSPGLVAILVATVVWRVSFCIPIHWPGIGDPNYYDDVARSLARDEGLKSRCLWNLTSLPPELPYPACGYWGPVLPVLLGVAYRLFGIELRVGQALMVVLALLLCLVGDRVTRLFLKKNTLIVAAGGLLAFHLPMCYFSATLDTPVPFALFANLCLWPLTLAHTGFIPGFFLAIPGALASQLTRADGILLPILVFGFAVRSWRRGDLSNRALALLVMVYLAAWSPWLIRNQIAFSTPFPSSVTQSMALREYSDLFRINTRPSLATFLQRDPGEIVRERIQACISNIRTLMFGENMIPVFLFLIALPTLISNPFAAPFLWYSLLLFLAMSLAFGLQSENGSFMHSVPALYPFLFAGAMEGIDSIFRRVQPGPGPSLFRRVGRTLEGMAPWLLVLFFAVHSSAGFLFPGPFRVAFDELDKVHGTLEEWRTQQEGKDRDWPLMSNDSLALVGLLGNPVIQEPRDPGDDCVFDLARRYRVEYLVLFENVRTMVRPWDRPSYSRGRSSLHRDRRFPLNCPVLGLSGIVIYRFDHDR